MIGNLKKSLLLNHEDGKKLHKIQLRLFLQSSTWTWIASKMTVMLVIYKKATHIFVLIIAPRIILRWIIYRMIIQKWKFHFHSTRGNRESRTFVSACTVHISRQFKTRLLRAYTWAVLSPMKYAANLAFFPPRPGAYRARFCHFAVHKTARWGKRQNTWLHSSTE